MQAVILAGGFGTRLQPLTERVPKPMVPLAGRPLMEFTIRRLRDLGITEIIILLYYQPQVIRDYFGDGSDWGVRLHYLTPPADLGTAGAVAAARQSLHERFLVLSGDVVSDLDLARLIAFHESKGAVATIALTRVSNPLAFGVVITDDTGRIVKFVEKPGWSEIFSDTVNTGIYVLEPSVLQPIGSEEEADFSKDVFPGLLEKGARLMGCVLDGYWMDVGNTDAYLQVHQDLFHGLVNLEVSYPSLGLIGRDVRVGADAHIGKNVRFTGTVIVGPNSRLHEGAVLENCAIGANCVIEAGARIDGAVLWNNVFVRRGARIGRAVLGDNVRVDHDARVENGAVVADGAQIGSSAVVRRNVKVWPQKSVESGAVLASNLVWGDTWRRNLFAEGRVAGLTNVELTPELMAKLGAAYGSSITKGARVIISRDAAKSSRMLKRAFIGGVSSAGIHVGDLHSVPAPVARFLIPETHAAGGAHFEQSAEGPASTVLSFYDENGLPVAPSLEKNIERIFTREDFRRVHYQEPGGISEVAGAFEHYRDGLWRAVGAEARNAIRLAGFNIIVDLANGPAAAFLPAILAELGVNVITVNANPAAVEEHGFNMAHDLAAIAKIVTALEADAGLWLHPDGSHIALVDDGGSIHAGTDMALLAVNLISRIETPGSLVLPINLPSGLGDVARNRKFSVHESKLGDRAVAEACANKDVRMGVSADARLWFPGLGLAFDGLYAGIRLLALAALSGAPVSAAGESLPMYHQASLDVSVPVEMKGAVMRRMAESTDGKEASFLDGVKVRESGGWVLAVPDAARGSVHLFSEGRDGGDADRRVHEYRRLVTHWVEEMRGEA